MSNIPKIFYQTWKTKDIQPDTQKLVDSWRKLNPEYRVVFHDDKDCEEFIQQNYPSRILDAYKQIGPGAFKSDFWRYLILYKTGGVYADIDTICKSPIKTFLPQYVDFVTPVDLPRDYRLFNAFIASVPKHPILEICIDRIVNNVEKRAMYRCQFDYTGPGVLGKAVNQYMRRNELSPFLMYGKIYIKQNSYIYLLKFNKGVETITDTHNRILFQNKNGCQYIKNIYQEELKSVGIEHYAGQKPYIDLPTNNMKQ